jgi:hypothetical protein
MLIRMKAIAVLVFAAAPLFASNADLTLTSAPPSSTVIRAGVRWFTGFDVHNAGPDVASNVVVTATSSIDVTCNCSLGNIPAGQTRTVDVQFPAPDTPGPFTINATVASSASDPNTGDPSGYGEGQRSLGSIQVLTPPHFHFEATGDLTDQFISATATRINYVGFAKPPVGLTKPEGISEGLLTQTSEFSRWLEVR